MDLWVFDNDGTLYDDSEARQKFMELLYRYISELLNIPLEQAPDKATKLKEKWDTEFTPVALMKEFGWDFSEIVRNTYLKINLDECSITAPDSMRFRVLSSIKNSRKVVFTNNSSTYARYLLSYVGLETCFSDIIGLEETDFRKKPDSETYKVVERRHRGFNRIIFCDDSLKNLGPAQKLGWITIWCKPKNANAEAGRGHIVISSFEELIGIL